MQRTGARHASFPAIFQAWLHAHVCHNVCHAALQLMHDHPTVANPPLFEHLTLARSGEVGVHTYRIPALAVANDGTLLASHDARRDSANDLVTALRSEEVEGHTGGGVAIPAGASTSPVARATLSANGWESGSP
jgi:hypothetical protein